MTGSESEETLRAIVGDAAVVVALVTAAMVLAACGVELLRRRGRAARLVRGADRLLPAPSRRLAAVLVTAVVVAVPATAAAGAARAPSTDTGTPAPAGSLRDWLRVPADRPAPTPATTAPSVTTTAPVARGRTRDATTTTRPAASPSLRPAPAPAPPASTPTATPTPTPTQVLVVPGDCLWNIAARELGPGASAVQIDRAWRAIWAANRERIGADPNLIHPGLELDLPVPNVP